MSPDYYRVTLIGGPTEYWQAEKSSIVYDPSAPPMPKDPSPKVGHISAQRSLFSPQVKWETVYLKRKEPCIGNPKGKVVVEKSLG